MNNISDEDSCISYLWFASEQIPISMNAFVTQNHSMIYFYSFLYSDGVNKNGFITAQYLNTEISSCD